VRTRQERLSLLDQMLTEAGGQGLLLRTPDDTPLDGRTITMDGQSLLNFGSCSYLGLELDPRMREAVCAAVMRYGTQFSSSRTYLSAPPYPVLEELLGGMFGGHVLVAPSTSLAHIAALPVLVGDRDVVVMDQQVHSSVQVAVAQLKTQGIHVELVRHNRMDLLEDAVERLGSDHEHVWYLADGVYSMFADLAPFEQLGQLLARHEQLQLYIDDSHGVGWSGTHGRGPALEHLGGHDRLVVAASLNKSFAAAGGALIFPDEERRRRVRTLGGPMIFSGPVPPPMLGAALASVAIHRSPELRERQAALQERIALCDELLTQHGLPVASDTPAPIRYVRLGLPQVAQGVVGRLMEDGFYTNLAIFPAVPIKQAGVRFTLTLHHEPEDIEALVGALARSVPSSAPRPAHRLRLEHHRTIDALDEREWDGLLGDRGTFDAAGLRFLEATFGGVGRPEDEWAFHYYVVRDDRGAPVLATFFTAALWKDDMLASAQVSVQVEERRASEPYFLTSRTFAMGSLLTEGDHLYLDRSRRWREALDLLIDAVASDAAEERAATTILRDVPARDDVLCDVLAERGFVRIAMPDSFTIDAVAVNDGDWLAGLSVKSRAHQRRDVLPWDGTFNVEVLHAGSRRPSDAELDQLHRLYCNVRDRSLELNTFELPRRAFREMLAHQCWELVVLRLGDDDAPVAFGAHFLGRRHYAPMIVGLDYRHVRSSHSYRQALRQALLRARALRAERVLLGMGAPLEKRRFGARAEARVSFAQSADHFGQEVLALAERRTVREGSRPHEATSCNR
jgi:7-keto-8-aminopelargonate synthetase-like enzyme